MNRTVRWISIIFILVVIGVPLADVISNPQVHLEDLFKLGIDLQGGTSLIYELRAMEEQVEGGATVDASDAASVIVQRIDPQGLKNYVVRPMGKSRLEIVLPGRRVRVRISDEETTDEVMRAEAARLVAPGDGKTPAVPEDWQKFTGGITLNVDLEPPLILADIQDKIADAVRERHPDKLDVPWIVPGTKEKDASLKFRHIRVWIAEPYSGAARAVWSQLVSRALAEHTDLARVKRLVAQSGHLEFRMLVGRTISAKTKWDQLVADRRAGKPLESSIYRWYPVKIKRRGLTKERQKAAFENSVGEVSGSNAIYVDDPESLTLDVLVNVGDGQNVTGADMQFAKRYSTGEDGPVVLFGMKPKSTERFRTLMGQKNVGKHIAIILDGVVQSYPVLKTRLHDGGIISGYKGRPHERDEVVTLLNSGRIEASIYGPISERTVGPELGQDNIRKGRDAMIIGSIVVVAFMIIYYLGAGVVAVFALVLEITLVIMGMHWMDGTWTLPGIAGLVLTVGMSVDANVLIFERIREEKERGGSLALAIKNGYRRAFRTILDANLTTLITAVVLLWVGMEELKGFAIIIILGLLMNMFTAIVITRIIFDTGLKIGLLKKMKMLRLFKRPNINWMGPARIAVIVSGILIVVGASYFFAQGDAKYDIEFTGGTEVELRLREPLGPDSSSAIASVRRMVASIPDPLFATAVVQEVQYQSDIQQGKWGLRYLILVRAPKEEKVTQEKRVKDALLAKFADFLPVETTSEVSITTEKMTEEFLLAEAGRPPGRKDLPEEYRRYLGCIRIIADCRPPLFKRQIRSKIEGAIKNERPDIAQTAFEIRPVGAPDKIGAYEKFEVRIQAGYDQEILGKAAHEVWTGIVSGALQKRADFAGVTSFSSQIGEDTRNQAIIAILIALVCIVAYIWIRFARVSYGIAAIAALVHDVFITLGAVVIFSTFLPDTFIGRALLITDMKIGLPMIGAFLTLIGYSLNDTIVVFDRIRENRGKFGELSISTVNKSINQTFSRTILTSVTTLMVVAALYWFGGTSSKLHGFAFVMLFGVLVGTYSSMAVASPILVLRGHLLKMYTWFYPLIALIVLVYYGPVRSGAEFASSAWGPIWAIVEVAWLTLAVAAIYAFTYQRRVRLLESMPWVIKGMAVISLFAALPGLVVLGLIALSTGWTWAILGTFGCFISMPLAYVLYKVSWRSDILEPDQRSKTLTSGPNSADK